MKQFTSRGLCPPEDHEVPGDTGPLRCVSALWCSEALRGFLYRPPVRFSRLVLFTSQICPLISANGEKSLNKCLQQKLGKLGERVGSPTCGKEGDEGVSEEVKSVWCFTWWEQFNRKASCEASEYLLTQPQLPPNCQGLCWYSFKKTNSDGHQASIP